MNVKRHLGLIVTGAITLLLVIVLGVMLIRFQGEYRRVRAGLASAESRLQRLHERDPYPSNTNVEMVRSNLVVLQRFYDQLYSTLKLGQVESVDLEPAGFPPLLDRTIKRLYARASEGGVQVPPRFSFGFERYALGSLPNKEDVARLNVQLRAIEKICEIIFNNKVSELTAVERTVFEKGVIEQMAGTGRRRVFAEPEQGVRTEEWKDPSGLFSRETFTFSIVAPDSVILNLLNNLARSGLFVVVSSVEMIGEVPSVKPAEVTTSTGMPSAAGAVQPPRAAEAGVSLIGGPAPGEAGVAPKEPPPHEERIVAGRAKVKATLQIRVYRFIGEETSQEITS